MLLPTNLKKEKEETVKERMEQEVHEISGQMRNLLERFRNLSIKSDEFNECIYLDLCCLHDALQNATETIREMESYILNPETDYVELWERKKAFAERVRQSKENWIRTEILNGVH